MLGMSEQEKFLRLADDKTNKHWDIPICFEDDCILALNKPAGLLSSPDRYNPDRPNLMKLLHNGISSQKSWAVSRNLQYLANIHRLDYETSGVLLLAKDKATLTHLTNQFGSLKPIKTYLALVSGSPTEDNFVVDAKIAPNPYHPGIMRVDDKRGKKSITKFEVAERFVGFTLIKCYPLTGRTHQIRVHLRHAKLYLLGDMVYGAPPLLLSSIKPNYKFKKNREEKPLISRTALHALSISVIHPRSNTQVLIQAPIPEDFEITLKYLSRFAKPYSSCPNQVNPP